jgi:hypothetical protein|tara:strand:+ start:1738 stop:1965 length:228 start_codon:yes stop_codon:yes gene_type:complete
MVRLIVFIFAIRDLGEADYQALKKKLLTHHNLYKNNQNLFPDKTYSTVTELNSLYLFPYFVFLETSNQVAIHRTE